MKNIGRFINKYFPDIRGSVWVDIWSTVALVRFAMGLPVDATTLGVVFGAYVIHRASQTVDNNEAK